MSHDDDKPSVDKMIDANLRRVYDSVLQEDVPDRFADLLRRLESGEATASATEGGPSGPDRAGDR